MIETQLHLWQILAANGAIGLGAFIQSGTGFGMGLVPGIITGTLIAPPFRRYLDRTDLRPALLVLAAAGAIALIVRDLI